MHERREHGAIDQPLECLARPRLPLLHRRRPPLFLGHDIQQVGRQSAGEPEVTPDGGDRRFAHVDIRRHERPDARRSAGHLFRGAYDTRDGSDEATPARRVGQNFGCRVEVEQLSVDGSILKHNGVVSECLLGVVRLGLPDRDGVDVAALEGRGHFGKRHGDGRHVGFGQPGRPRHLREKVVRRRAERGADSLAAQVSEPRDAGGSACDDPVITFRDGDHDAQARVCRRPQERLRFGVGRGVGLAGDELRDAAGREDHAGSRWVCRRQEHRRRFDRGHVDRNPQRRGCRATLSARGPRVPDRQQQRRGEREGRPLRVLHGGQSLPQSDDDHRRARRARGDAPARTQLANGRRGRPA